MIKEDWNLEWLFQSFVLSPRGQFLPVPRCGGDDLMELMKHQVNVKPQEEQSVKAPG